MQVLKSERAFEILVDDIGREHRVTHEAYRDGGYPTYDTACLGAWADFSERMRRFIMQPGFKTIIIRIYPTVERDAVEGTFYYRYRLGLLNTGDKIVTLKPDGDQPMENQHRHIKGYRELGQDEIDLMNKIKQKGVELGELIKELRPTPSTVGMNTIDQRWVSIGETHLQQGIMALTRAVAKPESF